jgi:hypothetical protein
MPDDEFQAAVAIANLQAGNRELRAQLRQALERGDQLAATDEQLQKRLAGMGAGSRAAGGSISPSRAAKVRPSQKKRSGRKAGHAGSALYHERDPYSAEQFAEHRSALSDRIDRLLNHPCTQPGDVAVQNRLLKQQAHLLGCLEDSAAEPNNNRAERALGPARLRFLTPGGTYARKARVGSPGA